MLLARRRQWSSMFSDRKYQNKMKIHKRLLSEAMSCILQIQGSSLAESLWRHQSLTGSRARKISTWENTAERLQFIYTGAIRIFPVKLLSPGKYNMEKTHDAFQRRRRLSSCSDASGGPPGWLWALTGYTRAVRPREEGISILGILRKRI